MIADAKKPVVAAVERLVLGGGLELALVCVVHNIYMYLLILVLHLSLVLFLYVVELSCLILCRDAMLV